MALISVIVPVYNVEKHICRCIDSILNQTFQDFELILVDDGSSDNSGVICDKYAEKDNRIIVIHQENRGVSVARNVALDWIFINSDTQWISLIDSDDWVHPQFLEKLINAANENSVNISKCKFQVVRADENPKDIHTFEMRMRKPEETYANKTGMGVEAYPWMYLYARELFEEVRYPVGKVWEDLFTTYKLLFQVDVLVEIDAELYYYYVNQNGIVRSKWTVKNLNMLEAYEQNLIYFKDKNMDVLYKALIKGYFWLIIDERRRILQCDLRKVDKYLILQRLKNVGKLKAIKYTRQKYINIEKEPWIYKCFFPCLAEMYWIIRAMLNKIKYN